MFVFDLTALLYHVRPGHQLFYTFGLIFVGYTGALKAPVRCFGNHLSEKRKSLFQTDN